MLHRAMFKFLFHVLQIILGYRIKLLSFAHCKAHRPFIYGFELQQLCVHPDIYHDDLVSPAHILILTIIGIPSPVSKPHSTFIAVIKLSAKSSFVIDDCYQFMDFPTMAVFIKECFCLYECYLCLCNNMCRK